MSINIYFSSVEQTFSQILLLKYFSSSKITLRAKLTHRAKVTLLLTLSLVIKILQSELNHFCTVEKALFYNKKKFCCVL